ncbi:MAG: FIST C-terminal domain-containing protein [Rhodocyclales bacterium]|nr:FIST C-terminal domain-containing protein [Rhodocyclales bacterium]
MKTCQTLLKKTADPSAQMAPLAAIAPNLLLVFGAPSFFEDAGFADRLREACPDALLIGCSTAGEITAAGAQTDTCVATAVRFEKTALRQASTPLADMQDSHAAGARLAAQLVGAGLRAVMVFGQGVDINGSALLEGMTDVLGNDIPVTGGLAGDNGAFKRTWTLGAAGVSDRAVVALGFYGEHLSFGHGSFGGWEAFGPARKVTRSEGNVLFELDGEPALSIYKRYLGDYARDLPASGLLFPFAMLGEDKNATGLIRTILGVDESAGSLILAGAIQTNGYLKLMHASTDALVDGAEAAAAAVRSMSGRPDGSLGILVSCVGRRLVMGDRVDEEVEAVASVLGKEALLTGFYSYGEISPFAPGVACKLHNQTMTITSLAEV